MEQKPHETAGLGEGVVFAMQDRLSLLRRIGIVVIDLLIVYSVWFLSMELLWGYSLKILAAAWIAFVFFYLIVVKTYWRTLGYCLAGAKLVDIKGGRPGIARVCFRLLLTTLSEPFLDPLWFWIGKKRTLRDMLGGTYVVKASAEPVGRGEIYHRYIFVLSYTLMYREVSCNVGVSPPVTVPK